MQKQSKSVKLKKITGYKLKEERTMSFRADGKKLKNTDPMYTIIPYIMSARHDAMNMITLDIPVAPLQEYMREKKKTGVIISHMTLIVAAYLRAAAEYPYLNRFIVNKRIYARNDFTVSMVVLKEGAEDATMSKVHLEMTDDIFTVQKKFDEFIKKNRQPGVQNPTDKLIKFLIRIPGLLTILVGLLKIGDRYGLLPRSIIEASPFHNSLLISNLASIRTNHIYHHCYDFGTGSIFITLGNMREVPRRVRGEVEIQRCLPLGVVMDERICSGMYFSRVFARIKSYLNDPTQLEGPPRVVNRDDCLPE